MQGWALAGLFDNACDMVEVGALCPELLRFLDDLSGVLPDLFGHVEGLLALVVGEAGHARHYYASPLGLALVRYPDLESRHHSAAERDRDALVACRRVPGQRALWHDNRAGRVRARQTGHVEIFNICWAEFFCFITDNFK